MYIRSNMSSIYYVHKTIFKDYYHQYKHFENGETTRKTFILGT